VSKIEDYISFVKEQVSVQDKLSKRYEDDPYRRGLHAKAGESFSKLSGFLEEIRRKGTRDTAYLNRGSSPQKRIQLTYEDIENAPEELLKELNVSETDKQELLVEYLIAQEDGVLSLDRIMVDLYKRTREVPKRSTLISRLYRMVNRGMIYNVPGKKGVYSTYELSEQDAQKMFGLVDVEAEETPSSSAPAQPPSGSANRVVDRLKSSLMSSSAPTGTGRRA
jgi:Fe2+ or Zn2+ uptake regulation protein